MPKGKNPLLDRHGSEGAGAMVRAGAREEEKIAGKMLAGRKTEGWKPWARVPEGGELEVK